MAYHPQFRDSLMAKYTITEIRVVTIVEREGRDIRLLVPSDPALDPGIIFIDSMGSNGWHITAITDGKILIRIFPTDPINGRYVMGYESSNLYCDLLPEILECMGKI
jgi:hypothetical protein